MHKARSLGGSPGAARLFKEKEALQSELILWPPGLRVTAVITAFTWLSFPPQPTISPSGPTLG